MCDRGRGWFADMAPFRKMGPVPRERGVLRMRNYGREADPQSGSEPDKSLAPCVTWAVSEQRSARIHASRTRVAGSSGGLDNASGRLCPLSDDVVNRENPVDLWTGPLDQHASCGSCGQLRGRAMDNAGALPITSPTDLTTLACFPTTSSTGSAATGLFSRWRTEKANLRACPRSWLYQSGLCGYSETMKRHLNP